MHAQAQSRIIEKIIQSPQGEKAKAAVAAEDASARARLIGDRERLQAAEDVAAPKRQAAYLAAVAKVQGAERAYIRAKVELADVLGANIGASTRFSDSLHAIDERLRAGAEPAIAAFITEMWDLWHAALKAKPAPDTKVVMNQNTGEKTVAPLGKMVKPVDRADALREVIDVAKDLQLEVDQTDVMGLLAALRDGLPIIGAPVEG